MIKKYFPHYYCGRSRSGNMIYWEQCGEIDPPALARNGATVDIMVRHYIYMTEFCWSHLVPSPDSKTVTVFDVAGVGLSDLKGDVMKFVKKSTQLMQDHYPERAEVVIIVNAPGWFSFLYAVIKPLINERTQRKVRIFGRDCLGGLGEYMERDQIPERLGGGMRAGGGGGGVDEGELRMPFGQPGEYDGNEARWFSEDEVRFRRHVRERNKDILCKEMI